MEVTSLFPPSSLGVSQFPKREFLCVNFDFFLSRKSNRSAAIQEAGASEEGGAEDSVE